MDQKISPEPGFVPRPLIAAVKQIDQHRFVIDLVIELGSTVVRLVEFTQVVFVERKVPEIVVFQSTVLADAP